MNHEEPHRNDSPPVIPEEGINEGMSPAETTGTPLDESSGFTAQDVRDVLARTTKGFVKQTMANCQIALCLDPDIGINLLMPSSMLCRVKCRNP